MNKIIFNDSFDFGLDAPLAFIADDASVLRKCASSQVVDQWGTIDPIKGHTLIHLIALGAFEKTGCFFSGALVQTDKGMRPIEDLRTGDLVLTHKNRYRPVTTVFRQPFEGDAVEIGVRCLPEKIVSTDNHPFWIVRKDKFKSRQRCECFLTPRGKSKEQAVDEVVDQHAEFVPASSVAEGDFVIIPVSPEPVESKFFSMEEAYMFGIYLAEGCIGREYRSLPTKGKIRKAVFAMSIENDIDSLDYMSQVSDDWNRTLGIQESSSSSKGVRGEICDNKFAQECFGMFGADATTKRIPAEIFAQSDEWILEFLAAYFDGDGHITTKDAGSRFENVLRGSTASLNLALDLQRLLASVRIPSSVSKSFNKVSNGCFGSHDCPIYEISVGGAYSEAITTRSFRVCQERRVSKQKQAHGHTSGKYLLLPVKSVSIAPSDRRVKFNLEVEEDNTYVTMVAGHNSNRNGDAFPWSICKTAHPTFITKGALYRNHKAHPDKKEGYVVKTAFNEEMGRIELLVAAEMSKCADWLSKIEKGVPTAFSMGFNCTPGDVCSICDHVAPKREDYCDHVQKNASAPYGMGRILPDGRKCFVHNPWGYWNDISSVPVGADAIAMDLRKVAALGDDEVISGAELAENIGIVSGGTDLSKVALLRKLSAIEKRIQAMGMRAVKIDTKLDDAVAKKLRSEPVGEMLGELSKTGAILPIRDFFKLILGDEYADHSHSIEKAASLARVCYSRIADDEQALIDVCSNTTYTPRPAAIPHLWHSEQRKLAQDFSPSHEFACQRDMKLAELDTASVDESNTATEAQADYLLHQYAAYKLAAIQSQPGLDDQALLSAVLNS